MYKCILKWTKYIEVDCYFIREKVLLTSCINTNDQPADILNLTKSLRGTHFGFICDKLGALNLFENYSISLISCRKTKFLVTFCLFCIITFFFKCLKSFFYRWSSLEVHDKQKGYCYLAYEIQIL